MKLIHFGGRIFPPIRSRARFWDFKRFETPMTPDLRFDLGAMAKEVKSHPKVTIVFIANPNNPTGTYVPTAEVREFLVKVSKIRNGSVIVAIDSAYTEYTTAKDLEDSIELQREFPNVVVFRTFFENLWTRRLESGLRRCFACEIIATMDKVRQPFNVNSLGLVGAEAALGDQAFVKHARGN